MSKTTKTTMGSSVTGAVQNVRLRDLAIEGRRSAMLDETEQARRRCESIAGTKTQNFISRLLEWSGSEEDIERLRNHLRFLAATFMSGGGFVFRNDSSACTVAVVTYIGMRDDGKILPYKNTPDTADCFVLCDKAGNMRFVRFHLMVSLPNGKSTSWTPASVALVDAERGFASFAAAARLNATIDAS